MSLSFSDVFVLVLFVMCGLGYDPFAVVPWGVWVLALVFLSADILIWAAQTGIAFTSLRAHTRREQPPTQNDPR